MNKYTVIYHDRSQNLCDVSHQIVEAESLVKAFQRAEVGTLKDYSEVECDSDMILAAEDNEGNLVTVVRNV